MELFFQGNTLKLVTYYIVHSRKHPRTLLGIKGPIKLSSTNVQLSLNCHDVFDQCYLLCTTSEAQCDLKASPHPGLLSNSASQESKPMLCLGSLPQNVITNYIPLNGQQSVNSSGKLRRVV